MFMLSFYTLDKLDFTQFFFPKVISSWKEVLTSSLHEVLDFSWEIHGSQAVPVTKIILRASWSIGIFDLHC